MGVISNLLSSGLSWLSDHKANHSKGIGAMRCPVMQRGLAKHLGIGIDFVLVMPQALNAVRTVITIKPTGRVILPRSLKTIRGQKRSFHKPRKVKMKSATMAPLTSGRQTCQ